MALQFILGPSGTGKTTYIFDEMIRKSMNENKSMIYVSPEQMNMLGEQQLIQRHPNGGSMDIAILSFTRLAFKVFDELNIETREILDDYGKSMVLMKILKAQSEQLEYYGRMVNRQGFVEEMKSVISEFYQYQIDERTIDELLQQISKDKSLYYKLKDLKVIMHSFSEELSTSFMVAEQILSLLKEVICDSELLSNVDLYFDGFTGFSPAQLDVIEQLIQMDANVYIALTLDSELIGDNNYGNKELFSLGKETYDAILYRAQSHEVEVIPSIEFKTNYRLAGNVELQHLERQLFRFPGKIYSEDVDHINLFTAASVEEEIEYIANKIQHYVVHEGYQYRDFAVISGALSDSLNVWKHEMDKLQIPYFIDCSEMLSKNPFVEMLSMIQELFEEDFSYEGVFGLIKTGFLPLDELEAYQLENYVLEKGIRGYSMWSKPFRGNKKGLGLINETRKQFMEMIEPLIDVFRKKEAQGRVYVEALYDFLVRIDIARQIWERSLSYERQGKLRESKAYGQVYDKWLAVLDKTILVLGDEVIARDHLLDMLNAGVSDVRLGLIPTTLDQVVIGDASRTRLSDVRIVFVANANEGMLTNTSGKNGILIDKDRRMLEEMNVTIAPSERNSMHIEQYDFYLRITKATEKLYIGYLAGTGESATRPSYYVKRIISMFPKLSCYSVTEDDFKDLPYTQKQLLSGVARQVMNRQGEDSSWYNVLSSENSGMLEHIMDGYYYNNQSEELDEHIAKELYGKNMYHSVSKLETYAACEYQFFLRYGLGIQKRREYVVETSNIGTILHGVMENYFKECRNNGINPATLEDEVRDARVEELTRIEAEKENDTIFTSSYRNKHQLDVLIRIAKRSIEQLCRHLQQGSMSPCFFEKTFDEKDALEYIHMQLDEDICMQLKGIIDRVDIKETDDKVYVKVIDYKSGAKNIDFLKMYEGHQLQLTVYMSVMLELLQRKYPNKTIVPTGMYYFQLQDPIIYGDNQEKIDAQRIKDNRMTGLVNHDLDCLEIMDRKTGDVVSVIYKNDGTPRSGSNSLVSRHDLDAISEFVHNKMMDIGENIIHGQIHKNPEKGDKTGPCEYCDYRSICRFEPGVGGNQYRIHPKLTTKEARELILNPSLNETKGGDHDAMDN